MSVTRSPTKAAGAPSLTSSQPDLSKCELPVIGNFVFTRKRKQPDADVEVKEAIAELRKDMMSFLYEFKSSQKAEFQQVRSDVTDVKNQLESIKVANNDIIRDHNQFRKDLSSLTDSLDFQSKEQDDLKFQKLRNPPHLDHAGETFNGFPSETEPIETVDLKHCFQVTVLSVRSQGFPNFA
ncbi:unnamed protein product [Arctia plantaginis]|uniref:Uncharacterized protein n=1 Tax=Arctia plantaginis TaxID=874455 RepID=A0A8S1B960_ARCPL|nr:unnamed protein product [Arctia plantaginis]